jgi:hypothetical protein
MGVSVVLGVWQGWYSSMSVHLYVCPSARLYVVVLRKVWNIRIDAENGNVKQEDCVIHILQWSRGRVLATRLTLATHWKQIPVKTSWAANINILGCNQFTTSVLKRKKNFRNWYYLGDFLSLSIPQQLTRRCIEYTSNPRSSLLKPLLSAGV